MPKRQSKAAPPSAALTPLPPLLNAPDNLTANRTPSNLIPRTIPCPQCRKTTVWDANNATRPFCSARCRALDFGAWATDSYRIAGPSAPQEVDQASIDLDYSSTS